MQRRTLQQGRRRQDSDPSVVTLAETTFYLKGSQMSDAGTIVDLSVLDVFEAPPIWQQRDKTQAIFLLRRLMACAETVSNGANRHRPS
ncbi:hypothetical protein ABEV41_17550 [Geobacillus thermodenitrificans]|uniref:hypothetical protein n=1 Tax=Geobacillus thermodenitrificans TaxID=33940 RepID=UPI003D2355B4